MNAAVLGTGLIGGSVGAALRELGHRVTGWDPNPANLATARDLGLIDIAAADTTAAVADADLVVLAGPPSGVLEGIAALGNTDALVIDISGVKGPVVAAAGGLRRFVGTHPMAGREHGGPEHAAPGLFRGATWVLATDGAAEADLAEVEDLVRAMGARPLRMTAERHDGAVAAISHLPQMIAGGLISHAVSEADRIDLAAGSFRDLTRVALSDPGVWIEVLTANAAEVSTQLRALAGRLAGLADVVESGDTADLERFLADAQRIRRTLAPPVAQVGIILEDTPGELGRVGTALATSRVDVRDLQLRHDRHGGGGVLTLSVRPGEAEPLAAALRDQGFALA